MSFINTTSKEITIKIVYYGPEQSGKTTSLNFLQANVESPSKSQVKKSPEVERTLFFDFLPLKSYAIQGLTTRFQVYTVPGQPLYDDSRRLLLKGVDGVIFVVDSAVEKIESNLNSLSNLHENLVELGYEPNEIPLVFQYNKRDLPNAAALEDLREILNPQELPDVESVATTGKGIYEAFKTVASQSLANLAKP